MQEVLGTQLEIGQEYYLEGQEKVPPHLHGRPEGSRGYGKPYINARLYTLNHSHHRVVLDGLE